MDNHILKRILLPPTLHNPIFPEFVIRTHPEDFQVEELPAYQPDGSGEHLFLWIEKRGVAPAELISRIARTLRIRSGDIGVAGQKDRHAVTRQFVSVPRSCEAKIADLESDQIRILSVSAHRHKLRTGHLRGNQFCLLLRRTADTWSDQDLAAIQSRLQLLMDTGFPAYFGPQRFGHSGSSLRDGLQLLQGTLSRKRWPFHQQRFMTRMVLSAVQSAVFNLVVADRVQSGTVCCPMQGDVVIRKHGSRPFLMSARDTLTSVSQISDSEQVDSLPYIPAGPMPGSRMLQAEEPIRAIEQQMLQQLGLQGNEFDRFARLCSGTRRSMLEFPEAVSAEICGNESSLDAESDGKQPAAKSAASSNLRIRFQLRPGTYATVLLRELAESIRDAATVNAGEPEDPDVEMHEG